MAPLIRPIPPSPPYTPRDLQVSEHGAYSACQWVSLSLNRNGSVLRP